jgi:hypothetical protein
MSATGNRCSDCLACGRGRTSRRSRSRSSRRKRNVVRLDRPKPLTVVFVRNNHCRHFHVGYSSVFRGINPTAPTTFTRIGEHPAVFSVPGAVPLGRTSRTPWFAIIAFGRGLIAVIRNSKIVAKPAADDVPDGVGGSTGPGAVGAWGGGGSADTAWNSAMRRGSSKRSHVVREDVIASIGGR